MRARVIGYSVFFFMMLSWNLHASAQVMMDENGKELIWVEPYSLPSGEVVEGFWRNLDQHGQVWVEPFYAEDEFIDAGWVEIPVPEGVGQVVWEPSRLAADGELHEGYWRTAEREGYAWGESGWQPLEDVGEDYVYEGGHVGEQHVWVNGFYRPRVRVGFVWIGGYYAYGVYHYGYWRPAVVPAGYTYVYGHIGPDGYWVDGFFRPSVYDGYVWSDGYYVGSAWYWGAWHPVHHRHGHVYVHGHVHNGYWVHGHWRNEHYHGHHWTSGYYQGGVYHKGKWVKGNKPVQSGTVQVHYAQVTGSGSAGTSPTVHYAEGNPVEAVPGDRVGSLGRPTGAGAYAGRNASIRFGTSVANERFRLRNSSGEPGMRKALRAPRPTADASTRSAGGSLGFERPERRMRNATPERNRVANSVDVRPGSSAKVARNANDGRLSKAQRLRLADRKAMSGTRSQLSASLGGGVNRAGKDSRSRETGKGLNARSERRSQKLQRQLRSRDERTQGSAKLSRSETASRPEARSESSFAGRRKSQDALARRKDGPGRVQRNGNAPRPAKRLNIPGYKAPSRTPSKGIAPTRISPSRKAKASKPRPEPRQIQRVAPGSELRKASRGVRSSKGTSRPSKSSSRRAAPTRAPRSRR